MKCPWCGSEMKKGFVQSLRRILFTTTRNEGWFDIKEKEDVVLSAKNFSNPTCVAHHCGACRKVVIDYEEKPE